MAKNTTIRTASELAELLRPIDPWTMARYLQSVAVDQALEKAQRELDASLQCVAHDFDTDMDLVAVDLVQRSESPPAKTLAGLIAVKSTLDACQELPAIKSRLEPLFAEYHAARRQEAEAARTASLEAQERREKIEAAKAKALAEVEKQFATV